MNPALIPRPYLPPNGLTFGAAPSYRLKGFLLGWGALGGAVALGYFAGFGGALPKLILAGVVLGLTYLFKSFRVRGAKLAPEGVEVWDFRAWFFGCSEQYPATGVAAAALDRVGEKYTVRMRLHDGRSFTLPAEWNAARDAQQIIRIAQAHYGAAAEVALADPDALQELADFEHAPRLLVLLRKARAKDAQAEIRFQASDVLKFRGDTAPADPGGLRAAAATLARVRIAFTLPWFFGRRRAEFQDADGTSWSLVKSYARTRIYVEQAGQSQGTILVKDLSLGQKAEAIWEVAEGVQWRAVLTGAQHWNPATIRFYLGSAEGGRPPAALLDGNPARCTLDIARPGVCPWVAVGLAALFLVHGKQVKLPK